MKTIFTLLMSLIAYSGFAGNGNLMISRDQHAVNLSWTAEVTEGYFIVERKENGNWKQVAVVFPGEGNRGYFVKDHHKKNTISYRISHVHNNERSVIAESLQQVITVSKTTIEQKDSKLVIQIADNQSAPTAEFFTADGILLHKQQATAGAGNYVVEIPESLKGRMILRLHESAKKASVLNISI